MCIPKFLGQNCKLVDVPVLFKKKRNGSLDIKWQLITNVSSSPSPN